MDDGPDMHTDDWAGAPATSPTEEVWPVPGLRLEQTQTLAVTTEVAA